MIMKRNFLNRATSPNRIHRPIYRVKGLNDQIPVARVMNQYRRNRSALRHRHLVAMNPL